MKNRQDVVDEIELQRMDGPCLAIS
jgi:hypothetical protein